MKRRDFLKVLGICAVAPTTGLEIVGRRDASQSPKTLPRANWRSPYNEAIIEKLTRWIKEYQEKYPFSTDNKLEMEVAKVLGLMDLDGRVWALCPHRDATEAVFYVYMEGTESKPPNDHQYFYARIQMSGCALATTPEENLKLMLEKEVNQRLGELLELTKKYKAEGRITGKPWPRAYGGS